MHRWLRFAVAAGIYRFRPTSWHGPVLLIVSILDVLVYAVALYVVMTTVFEFSGTDRFMTMLVGLVPLRWSIGCAVQASRVAGFVNVCEPLYKRPIFATMILAMGPSTLVFVVSAVLLVIGRMVLLETPAEIGHVIVWTVFVVFVHLTWNVLLVFVIIIARMRNLLLSEGLIIFSFLLLFILSPIIYQFSDIPATASHILTSMNPASHLIAGYQNALWFNEDVSLEVLPWVGAVGLAVLPGIFLYERRNSRNFYDTRPNCENYLLWHNGVWGRSRKLPDGHIITWVSPWEGDLPWVTGSDLFFLFYSVLKHQEYNLSVFNILYNYLNCSRVLSVPIPILTDRNRNILCAALSFGYCASTRPLSMDIKHGGQSTKTRLLVFEGIFDYSSTGLLSDLESFLDMDPECRIALCRDESGAIDANFEQSQPGTRGGSHD